MFIRRVWRTNPWAQVGFPDPLRLKRDMDRLFDLLWSEAGEGPESGVFPPMNITQDAHNYYVRAELPGMHPEDLKISVERNKLSVSGRREITPEGNGVSYHRRERTGGSFSRSISLPEELNADAVEARYSDGLLTVKLPKSEAAKARQIKVQTG